MKKLITLFAIAGMVLALAPAAQAAVVESGDLGSGSTHIYTFTLDDNTTATTTWTAPAGVTSIKLAVVAGGGGGGEQQGGGGGAGGLRTNDSYSVTAGATYNIQVGAGGLGPTWWERSNSDGEDSYFDSYISTGGGYGGGRNWVPTTGGSGGGANGSGGVPATGAAGTAGQGYAGGSTLVVEIGAGGGGAGGIGGDGAGPDFWNGVGGAGGTGIDLGTYFGLGASIGDAGYFAGGGGGAAWVSGGSGGLGGGGAGGSGPGFGSNGTPGTGGGGGADSKQSSYSTVNATGDGGSGIVIVSYEESGPSVLLDNGTTGNVDENQPIGTVVGSIVTFNVESWSATNLAFAGGTDDASFTIDGTNLLTAEVFDEDVQSSYSIKVSADDGGANATTNTFAITIDPVSEPVDRMFANAEVQATTTLAATLEAMAGGVTYGITAGEHHAALFEIQNTDELHLKNAATVGQIGDEYFVEVTATGGVTDSMLIKVTVVSGPPTGTIFLFN